MMSQPSLFRLVPSSLRVLLGLAFLSTVVLAFSTTTTTTPSSSSSSSDNNWPPQGKEAAAVSTISQDWVAQHTTNKLTNTVLCLPPEYFADTVVYTQNAIRGSNQLQGYLALESACRQWDETFSTDPGGNVQMEQCRSSLMSPTTMVTTWNVTWIPPTALWLQGLAEWNGWKAIYVPYVHSSDRISTFSYKAVGQLLWDALRTRQLRIPLACINGSTVYEFDRRASPSNNNSNSHQMIVVSIREDLAYAEELTRGVLQNRKCAQDLRLFLENGRRIPLQSNDDWQVVVAQALPWQSVPGMNPFDVDPNRPDEACVPAVVLGGVALTLVGFAALVAPELLGQSVWGPPTYIVPPSELNISYVGGRLSAMEEGVQCRSGVHEKHPIDVTAP
eukprot:scaffold4793_cov175-Amphora_coffeaeformis.AAC.3